MPPSSRRLFEIGDLVRHAFRPAWGEGRVESVERLLQAGADCQRLRVRFARAGLKTLSTAHASLELCTASSPGNPPPGSPAGPSPSSGARPAAALSVRATLSSLPADVTAAGSPALDRFAAALSWYAYEDTPRGLADWAAAHAQVSDPLAHVARHELEDLFARFHRALEDTVAGLLNEVRHASAAELGVALGKAPPAGRAAAARLALRPKRAR